MTKLERTYYRLLQLEHNDPETPALIDPTLHLLFCIVYLCLMLSVAMGRLSMLIWFAIIPIINCAIFGLSSLSILKKSLYVLPFIIFIGIFNPILDHQPAFSVGTIVITRGWITFVSILVRGLLAVQCLLILMASGGFYSICRSLRNLGMPRFLTDQLQFVYRYMTVLIQEAIIMNRAKTARGFGRKKYPVKLWGIFTGQLFLRAIDRAERINRAMLARGFTGELPVYRQPHTGVSKSGIVYFLLMTLLTVSLRIFDFSSLFFKV